MAYSFRNQNMSTLSNILIIHAAPDKGETADTTADTTAETTAETTADTTADTTAFTIPREVMKTDYGKFVVTNSIPGLRVVLADGTISSAKGKLIIDGTLDIECNY